MPKIFVVLFGCAANTIYGDEVKGYYVDETEARRYCETKNLLVKEGYAYFYEEANILPTL